MAAVDYFLRIDGIPGESADAKHKGEIEVNSWSWGEAVGVVTAGAGGPGGAGAKTKMDDFHFVMPINKASPKLLLACASGQHIKSAVLACRKAGGQQQEYLRFTFGDLLVSSYQTEASAGSDVRPIDQVSLAFGKIQVEYFEQKADGTLGPVTRVGWDQRQNKSF